MGEIDQEWRARTSDPTDNRNIYTEEQNSGDAIARGIEAGGIEAWIEACDYLQGVSLERIKKPVAKTAWGNIPGS